MKPSNVDQFMQQMQAASEASNAYISASPLWVQIWIGIMMAVLLPSFILAFKKSEARHVAWSLVLLGIWTPILIHAFGASRLWGITHLSFWTPVFVIALVAVIRNGLEGWYQKWLAAVVAVIGVSLVFDIYDVLRFFSGEV